ncbi:glycosyl hydrolase family 28-related protein [Brucella pseudintermedia]|uniref:glycosyl hydrolase family 28-related protein n=1 Tax=Brucella pseudintermedia TaxID=370111 RepID=UPI0036702CE2|nr:glycosyl hydrolase family 28-related protein [Brucella pseudintermedia]
MTSIQINRQDGLSSATAYKGPCRVATTTDTSLSDLKMVDGVALNDGDRVVVRAQTDARQNGIYVVQTGLWRRARDFASNKDVRKGTRVWVTEGNNGPAEFEVRSENPVVIGVTNVTFELSSGSVNAAALAKAVRWAEEWAQSESPVSVEAGGDGLSDHSSKWWAERAGDYANDAISGGMTPGISTALAVAGINIPVAVSFFRTGGYSSPGDGGAALYKRVASEPSHAGKVQSADGAWWELAVNEVDPRMFGARGDGTTPNGDLLNDALIVARAIGAVLVIPEGTFLSRNIVVNHKDVIRGKNRYKSIIKAEPSMTGGLIQGKDLLSLIGTEVYDINAGASQVQISDLTLMGAGVNNNPDQLGIAIWGYATNVQRVNIRFFSSHGMLTEWTDGAVSMEGTFRDIVIFSVGQHGWSFSGPHDSYIENVMIIDASQRQNFGWNGVYIGKGNGRWINCHVWHTSTTAARCDIGFRSNGANELVACHLEGCRVQLWHAGDGDRVVACNFYASFGNNGDALVLFIGNANQHSACRYENLPLPASDARGVQFGFSGSHAPALNSVDTSFFSNFKTYGAISFVNSGGSNRIINCFGYCESGGTTSVGSPTSSDFIQYLQNGTYININKPQELIEYANDAAAAAGGVPVGGLYKAGGQVKVRSV